MAVRFLRLDLSPNARDFEGVALEPGLPLLDQSNANYRTLQRWLGRLVGEPQRSNNSVDFFVCDDQQGRLNEVSCEPATVDDLRCAGGLKQDLEEIGNRLEKVAPASPAETKLLNVVKRQFQKLTSEPPDVRSQLFKYQRAGKWHLIWAWGYQPKDLVPATTKICTNPSCALLFLKTNPGTSACPACESVAGAATVRKKRPARALMVIVGGVVLLAGLGYALKGNLPGRKPNDAAGAGFFANPASATLPVGGRIEFTLVQRDADGIEVDVTSRVVAVIEDRNRPANG